MHPFVMILFLAASLAALIFARGYRWVVLLLFPICFGMLVWPDAQSNVAGNSSRLSVGIIVIAMYAVLVPLVGLYRLGSWIVFEVRDRRGTDGATVSDHDDADGRDCVAKWIGVCLMVVPLILLPTYWKECLASFTLGAILLTCRALDTMKTSASPADRSPHDTTPKNEPEVRVDPGSGT